MIQYQIYFHNKTTVPFWAAMSIFFSVKPKKIEKHKVLLNKLNFCF